MDYSFLLNYFFSFLGGILGAGIGGLNAFIFCGISLFVGTIINLVSTHPSAGNIISWGPILGPHVAFAGGVASAAYAASIGKIATGRDVVTRLARFNAPMIYIVGGIFGIAGYSLKSFADVIPTMSSIPLTNSIAFSITINAIIVRLIFGKTALVNCCKTPYTSWQPWKYGSTSFLFVATGVAVISSVLVHQFPSMLGIMLGIASISLIILYFKVKIPIVLHIAWAAEFITFLSGDIGWGVAFGVLTALIGEFCGYFFLVNGDTHIDPPAMSLVIVFLIYPLMIVSGMIALLQPYSFGVALSLFLAEYFVFSLLEKRSRKVI